MSVRRASTSHLILRSFQLGSRSKAEGVLLRGNAGAFLMRLSGQGVHAAFQAWAACRNSVMMLDATKGNQHPTSLASPRMSNATTPSTSIVSTNVLTGVGS